MKYNGMKLFQVRADLPIGIKIGKLTHQGGYFSKPDKRGIRRPKDIWECECGTLTILSPPKASRHLQCHVCDYKTSSGELTATHPINTQED
jgi:hypothetical protein